MKIVTNKCSRCFYVIKHWLNSLLHEKSFVCLRPKDLAMTIFLLLFFMVMAPDSHAGMVYGKIRDNRERIVASGTTMLENSNGRTIRIRVDREGNYKISIPPGYYRVIHRNQAGRIDYEGWLSSSPNASQQDIKMIPAR